MQVRPHKGPSLKAQGSVSIVFDIAPDFIKHTELLEAKSCVSSISFANFNSSVKS